MNIDTMEGRLNALEALADFLNGTREACETSHYDHTFFACQNAIERLWEVMKAANRDRK